MHALSTNQIADILHFKDKMIILVMAMFILMMMIQMMIVFRASEANNCSKANTIRS